MSLNNFGLGFSVTATDGASQVFQKVGGSLGKMEHDGAAAAISLQEAGEQLKGMGEKFSHFGDMIGEGLLSAAEHASTFDESILKSGAFVSATAAEMDALRAAAMNTDLVMRGFSFETQSKALEALANETNNAADAMNELGPALTFAKMTGQDAAASAHTLSDILSGFGKKSSEAAATVDEMAFAMKKFGLESNELQGALMPTIGATKLMGGTFEDTLTIVGLANSQLGNVRKSAVAASMAMNQLADPSTQADFAALGVAVKDTTGNFRPMLDILGDVSAKTAGMTAAQKAQRLASIYSAKTAGGLNVVMDQLAQGVKDASGKMLTGAAAAAELKNQMQNAHGAAEGLSEAALNTFGEQKKALGASISSFMVAIGGPVQEVLAPIVRGLVLVIAKITHAFVSLSPGVKRFIVGLVAGVGALASFIGAALAGAGAVAALVLAGKALLIGLAAVAGVVMVLATMFLPLILAASTLYIAWTRDIGGIATSVRIWFDKIRLAFTALWQVFSQGGFSMAVYKELDKAENSGIKAFAINAFLWFNRIKNFFMRLGETFSAGMERVGPIIEKIVSAIQRLAGRFSSTTDAASKNKDAFQRWGDAGAKVADFLVGAIELVAKVILGVVNFIDGFAETFHGLGDAFDAVVDAGKELGSVIADLFSQFSTGKVGAQDTADLWRTIGQVFGWVASAGIEVIVIAFRVLGGVISFVGGIVQGLGTLFSGILDGIATGVQFIAALLEGNWGQAWKLAEKGVTDWATTIIQMFAKVIAGAVGMVDSLAKIFKVDLGLKGKVTDFANSIAPQTSAVGAPSLPAPAAGAAQQAPAVAAAQGGAANTQALAAAVASAPAPKQPDINVKTQLVIDGQVLADTVQKHSAQQANRGFAPTPSPT